MGLTIFTPPMTLISRFRRFIVIYLTEKLLDLETTWKRRVQSGGQRRSLSTAKNTLQRNFRKLRVFESFTCVGRRLPQIFAVLRDGRPTSKGTNIPPGMSETGGNTQKKMIIPENHSGFEIVDMNSNGNTIRSTIIVSMIISVTKEFFSSQTA